MVEGVTGFWGEGLVIVDDASFYYFLFVRFFLKLSTL